MKNDNGRPMRVNKNRSCLGDYIMKTEHNGAGRYPQGLTPVSDKNHAYMALKAAINYNSNDTDNFIDALDQFIHATINEGEIPCSQVRYDDDIDIGIGQGMHKLRFDLAIRLLPSSELNGFILCLGSSEYHVLLVDGSFKIRGVTSDTVTFDEKVRID